MQKITFQENWQPYWNFAWPAFFSWIVIPIEYLCQMCCLYHNLNDSYSYLLRYFVPWQSGLPFPRYNLTSTLQGQRYPSQHGIQVTHFLSVSHQAILSTPVPSVPWQSGLHSWDTICPWKFKAKVQGQRYPSQCSVQLTHFLSVSHQGILSTSIPFIPWQSGLPFPRYNLTLKIQGQRSRSKVP